MASWLRQSGGRDGFVPSGGLAGLIDGRGLWLPQFPEPCQPVPEIGAVGVDLATRPVRKAGHVPGAYFTIRVRLQDDLAQVPGQGRLC